MDVVAFNLMLSVQVCADVASHIIADQRYAPAGTIAGGFARLAEHGVISQTTAQRLGAAAGLRNAVAHGYATVDIEAVQRASVDGISDLRRFATEIAQWLASTSGAP